MKTVEVDDQIYAALQSMAIPFVDKSPNCVLRKLLLKNDHGGKKPNTVSVGRNHHRKAKKANLGKLVRIGLLKENQTLTFNYKEMTLSKEYKAQVSGGCILFEGQRYKMSPVVRMILEKEGRGIPSGSYRGPEYWVNSDGISVRQLWEQHLNKEVHHA